MVILQYLHILTVRCNAIVMLCANKKPTLETWLGSELRLARKLRFWDMGTKHRELKLNLAVLSYSWFFVTGHFFVSEVKSILKQ